ncbi:hypothetical protein HKT18_13615 [Flavobacterium sp. IMCC34852]|uniref:Uncharacterized protein n=1 Tax=Flavobacterium rivulicola TaxID=2732161 RepID=A0A7Y3RB52_9FLAO|nr:hypothetical protein [Flavobacterium sp. IMCC34852]NNT73257.1 hypothetical protein [Flavobacterium sp. IMCC34852]
MQLIITLFFTIFISDVQSDEKIYFGRAHNYSTVYSYGVTEIYISSDSTMTRFDYKLPNKREWKKYKKYKSEKKINIISKKGKYYSLIDPISRVENEMHCLKITENKVIYYYKAEDGSLLKGYTFNRQK